LLTLNTCDLSLIIIITLGTPPSSWVKGWVDWFLSFLIPFSKTSGFTQHEWASLNIVKPPKKEEVTGSFVGERERKTRGIFYVLVKEDFTLQ